MWILDSYEYPQTKFNAVWNQLHTAQWAEKWINFTLHMEMVKDFIKHAFTNKPDKLNMMKCFMPFCLQLMTQATQVSLAHLQEEMDETKTTSQNDVNKHNSMQKFKPIWGELKFLNLIANTMALSQVLFTNASPLTKGILALQEIVAYGHHKGDLAILEQFQPDWFTRFCGDSMNAWTSSFNGNSWKKTCKGAPGWWTPWSTSTVKSSNSVNIAIQSVHCQSCKNNCRIITMDKRQQSRSNNQDHQNNKLMMVGKVPRNNKTNWRDRNNTIPSMTTPSNWQNSPSSNNIDESTWASLCEQMAQQHLKH